MIFDRDEWLRWRFRDIRFHNGAAEHWLSQGDFAQAAGHARKLFENATRHKVPKYIAIAHKLLAQVAAGRGELAVAEAELGAALDQLRTHPVPILIWRIYAALGRLRLQLNDDQSAHAAFAQAAAIIHTIAAEVNDKRLRSKFMNSRAVLEVLEGVGR